MVGRIGLCSAMVALVLTHAGRVDAATYAEHDGLVVMEAEAVPVDGDWRVKTEIDGYTGDGYIEAGNSGTLQYSITFHNTGTYQFQWRASAPHKTEHNDSFIRMTGPSVETRSGSGSPCYTGDWIKVYGAGGSSWSWDARNCDNTQKHVSFIIDQTGDYVFEIKQRSTQHKIDRIVMNDESRVSRNSARDLSQGETLSDGSTPPPPPESVTIEAVDFDNKGDFYVDDSKYLAIDPDNDDDKTGTATEPFNGNDGTYDITFYGVGEEDGESMYKLYINDVLVGEYQVPPTTEAFAEGPEFNMTWTGVAVNSGDIIKVVATAHSNGTVNESTSPGGYAWSRARWYRIDFDPAGSSGGTTEPTAIVEPAAGTGIPMGTTITLKGTGSNLRWSYDANSDGLSEISIGNGAEVQFDVPTDVRSPHEITIILRGDGGTVERIYDLVESSTAAGSAASRLSRRPGMSGGPAGIYTVNGRALGTAGRDGLESRPHAPGTFVVRRPSGDARVRVRR